LPNRLNEVIDRFNSAAEELQNSEFRGARTPNEWERMFQARHARDYTKLFTAVDPLIEAFVVANPSERARISSRLTPAALGILGTFASSMPVLAVRRASPMLITQGLRALAIIGEGDDIRDRLIDVAILYHAATKLGIDTVQLFREVASLAPSAPLQDAMRSFPLRSPEDRDLSAFWIHETLTDGEFDLIPDSWSDHC
jgi:hypothetical protein